MRSNQIKNGVERAPNRSLLFALGLTEEEIQRPLVGVVSSYNEIVPGHMNLDKIAEAVKAGVRAAGGTPIEFPAIAGKVLSEVHYLPTSQQNDVSLDLFGADNSEPQYTLDYGDDGTWSYTLIDARENLRYRIEITNKKNAQLAKLKLVYAAAK